MQHEKIGDALILHIVEAVEFIYERWVCNRCGLWHEIDEIGDGGLDQIDAGGFKRLEKTAGKPDRHAIATPGLFASARRKPQQTRLRLRSGARSGAARRARAQCGHEFISGVVLIDEATREDLAVAGAMLQRNPPHPPPAPPVAAVIPSHHTLP